MTRSDIPLPQLRVVGATDLERRVLDAAARELPSVELTEKMQKALGISLAAGAFGAAAKATAFAAQAPSAAAPAFAWSAISVGVLALAMTGAVVGLRSNVGHHAANKPAAAVVAPPAPAVAATMATPAPAVTAPAFVAPAFVAPAFVGAPVAAAPTPVLAARATERPAVAVHARRRRAAGAMSSDLRAEIALVDAARTAVATGANDRALAFLQRYDGSYPTGTFRPEAAVLRIEALDHLGRILQARTLANKFIATQPDSPLADRVARLTGVPAR